MSRADFPAEPTDSPEDTDDPVDADQPTDSPEDTDSPVDADSPEDADGTAPAESRVDAEGPAHTDDASDTEDTGRSDQADDTEDGDGQTGWRRLRGQIGGALRRVTRFLSRITPPAPDPDFPETPTKSVRVSVLSATLCLGVSALLVSGKIVDIADRLPLGPERDRWLAAATEVDGVGSRLGLDRPYGLLRELRGAGDEAGQRIDVIGDVQDLLDLASTPDPFGSSEEQPEPTDPPDAPAGGSFQDPGSSDDRGAAEIPVESDDEAGAADRNDEDQTAGTASGNDDDQTVGTADDDRGPATEAAAGDGGSEHDPTDGAPDAPAGGEDASPAHGTDPLDPLDPSDDTIDVEAPEEPAAEHAPGRERPLPVSAEAPLRTYIAGDSQAFHLGHALRASPVSEVMDITLDQRHSTGLARPGYFNWPVHMFFVAVGSDPELLVMTLGSNDWQAMRSEDGQTIRRGSEEWADEWGRRLTVMLDALAAPHRQIVWVGLPPTRADDFREGYALMNGIVAGIAAERDFVTMIDIWAMFGGDAPYRESVPPPDDPDGAPVDVRNDDGVHVNRRGAEWVVDLIEEEVRRVWDPPVG